MCIFEEHVCLLIPEVLWVSASSKALTAHPLLVLYSRGRIPLLPVTSWSCVWDSLYVQGVFFSSCHNVKFLFENLGALRKVYALVSFSRHNDCFKTPISMRRPRYIFFYFLIILPGFLSLMDGEWFFSRNLEDSQAVRSSSSMRLKHQSSHLVSLLVTYLKST